MNLIRNIIAIVVGTVAAVLVYFISGIIIGILGSIPIIGWFIYYPSDASWAMTVLPPTAASFVSGFLALKIAKTAKPVSSMMIAFWVFNIFSMFSVEFSWRDLMMSFSGIMVSLLFFANDDEPEEYTSNKKWMYASCILLALLTIGLLTKITAELKTITTIDSSTETVPTIQETISRAVPTVKREEELASIIYEIYDNSDIDTNWKVEVEEGYIVVWIEMDGLIDLAYEAKVENNREAKNKWNDLIEKMKTFNKEDNDIADQSGYGDVLVGLNLFDSYEGQESEADSILAIIAGGEVLYDPVNEIMYEE